MISAATMLAAAKKGASWAREISCTSRSGELSEFGLARREARRFPAGKPSRNQALITIWSFVHPPAVPRAEARLRQRELKPG